MSSEPKEITVDHPGMRSPVGVGIIGAGNVLWAYLQVLDRIVPKGYAFEGPVCARRRETWPQLRSRRPQVRLVAEPAEVFDSEVEVVVIITPPESHVELTRLALERGKHVVLEKPFAPTYAEGEALFTAAAKHNRLLVAAPFVQLSPTFRAFWGRVREGAIGKVHSARGLYGNAGSTWASWYHAGGVGPLAEAGIYNLKSLTALLGPVTQVLSAETTAVRPRMIGDHEIADPDPDTSHVILSHDSGALSSIVSSQVIQRYRRPALEIYGTDGTANLLGDDWDPRGFEIWRNEAGHWEEHEPIDGTWLWADGLREAVVAIRENRAPLAEPTHDLHLLEIIEAARRSTATRTAVDVNSRFRPIDLQPEMMNVRRDAHHLHDHTRPADEQ